MKTLSFGALIHQPIRIEVPDQKLDGAAFRFIASFIAKNVRASISGIAAKLGGNYLCQGIYLLTHVHGVPVEENTLPLPSIMLCHG